MVTKKPSKFRFVKAILGCFLGIMGIITPVTLTNNTYAEPVEETTIQETVDEEEVRDAGAAETVEQEVEQIETRTCDDTLGSIGWLVCPTTGKISEAVDWLYDKNKELLEINPLVAEDDSPIYQIWKYCLGVANIAFVIFLLIAIYSQITGVGISNYGIKKALPKLIVAAIMVNLSFLVCSLAVDVSNIIGNGVRGVFTTVEESTVPLFMSEEGYATAEYHAKMVDMYDSLSGASSAAAVAPVVAFEGGEIWMLIPAVLGALVAVVVGLITIALRQVVVVLLIMIAPLAIVAYILPNTENLFKKWKNLLTRMLVFYPAYSLLFGASSLAGWAIIASANSGFMMILGVVVQIFPLFFSWSLMKMSGTFLGTINAKITGFFAKPLATNRAWAESHRELTRQKMLASNNAYTPSLRLRQFLSNRRIAREEEISELQATSKNRGLAYSASLHYKKNGEPSEDGIEAYDRQQRNMRYSRYIMKDKDNLNEGFGGLEAVKYSRDKRLKQRIKELDIKNMNEADMLHAEMERGEEIDYQNYLGRHKRFNDALNAHMDQINGYSRVQNENGEMDVKERADYKFHFDKNSEEYRTALSRYGALSNIVGNNPQKTQFLIASAAHAYDSKRKLYDNKMEKLFDYTVPTRDLVLRLNELSKDTSALENIDAIIAGMRILNKRGDTDLVGEQLDQVIKHKLQLGTRASQALASFLMFEVKDSDPFLRRFGKYINLETANMYNANKRQVAEVTYDEYIKGYHMENGEKMFAKKDATKLIEGTSLDNVERTAFGGFDERLKKAYGYNGKNGSNWDIEGYLKKRSQLMTAMEPAFLSAMQKWASGSEQMNSGVTWWLGYNSKQLKDANGKVVVDANGDPVEELSAVWDSDAFRGHEKELEEFYGQKADAFVFDQTASQIQNMRTDVRAALLKHLERKYFGDPQNDPEGYRKRKEEYDAAVKEIMSRQYEGKTEEEAKALRELEKKNYYYRNIVGKPYRELLYRSGKLGSLVKTSHSGGGNMMKDWNRVMTGLDDDTASKMVAELDKQEKEEKKKQQSGDEPMDETQGYNNSFDSRIVDEYMDLFESNPVDSMSREQYLAIVNDFLIKKFGHGDHKVKDAFYDYLDHISDHTPNYQIHRHLRTEILSDPNNYQ